MRVVFDVDGTLLRSTTIDAELYARAFVEVFGVPLPTTDWSRYRHATDRGIAEEAVAILGGDPARITTLRRCFVELSAAIAHIDQTPGAAELLAELRASAAVGIATGGWEAAARQKLRAGGLDVSGVPLVGSDEHAERPAILRAAIARLPGVGPVTYVGDGAWDRDAAREVGVRFLAIGAGAHQLDSHWLPDFTDREAFARMCGR